MKCGRRHPVIRQLSDLAGARSDTWDLGLICSVGKSQDPQRRRRRRQTSDDGVVGGQQAEDVTVNILDNKVDDIVNIALLAIRKCLGLHCRVFRGRRRSLGFHFRIQTEVKSVAKWGH